MSKHFASLVSALLAFAAPAFGQLQTVDQTIADISALAASLREIEPGLMRPNDFSNLYRLPDEQLMRVQGGLYAVFPQSVYGTDKEGRLLTAVPPGTTFFIGPPPNESVPVAAVAGSFDRRLNLRIAPRRVDGMPTARRQLAPRLTAPPPPQDASSIVVDPDYRADRVRALMRYAARLNRYRGEQRLRSR